MRSSSLAVTTASRYTCVLVLIHAITTIHVSAYVYALLLLAKCDCEQVCVSAGLLLNVG